MRLVINDRQALHATHQVTFEGNPFSSSEIPARAEVLEASLRNAGLGPLEKPVDHGLGPILAIHDSEYIAFLRSVYRAYHAAYPAESAIFPSTFATRFAGRRPTSFHGQIGYYAFGWGSPILEGTWEAAYWSAQCAVTAAEFVRGGERAAYALCRPPGHHAAADLFGGYCYLNNAAIAGRFLQQGDPDHRIAILDVDYHHGNGTQSIFYRDPAVLYCSLHADPSWEYPYYWGFADETGQGAGTGTNLNWPLPKNTADEAYLATLTEALEVIQRFDPRALVISLGLDTLKGDPVGGFQLSLEGVHEVSQRIASLSLPTVLVQEGGYLLGMLGKAIALAVQPFSAAS